MTSLAASPLASRWRVASHGDVDPPVMLVATCAAVMLAGAATGQPVFVGAGSAGLCMACRHAEQVVGADRETRMATLATRLLQGCGPYTIDGHRSVAYATQPAPRQDASSAPPPPDTPSSEVSNTTNLVESMLAAGRYALLLRPETAPHLASADYHRALDRLDEEMALVPAGSVLQGLAAERATLGQATEKIAGEANDADAMAHVKACYFDRRAVTNADYRQFVEAGAYDQLEFWPEEALPALFDFVDGTGVPGPRFWCDGHYLAGEGRLPVVGVSWYEAVAYARWVGRRLPSDAEWTKACAWPIESSPGRVAQRRYPWGEAFDARRANLWCAGYGGLAPVDDFAEGASVGGLEQMVGNVWEWTLDALDEATPRAVRFPGALRSIRGGAFNTYFENQATCHYQSGEHPLARRANIGFRLALDMTNLASPLASQETA